MKIKTADLQGAALDWAVAKCEGEDSVASCYYDDDGTPLRLEEAPEQTWQPSIEWAQGGSIIERQFISVECDPANDNWVATIRDNVPSGFFCGSGRTPLIAAMRCYVASKLGDEVEVPDTVAG